MALIQCYECDKQISDTAKSCPQCGAKNLIRKNNIKVFFREKWSKFIFSPLRLLVRKIIKRPLVSIVVLIILFASYLIYSLFFANCDGNCINGNGTYLFDNGEKYVGEWKYGKKHGKGTLLKNNNNIVTKSVGEFQDNTFIDGVEIMKGKFNNGGYVISCTNGELTGQGVKMWSNGKIFIGSFNNGIADGEGYIMSIGVYRNKMVFDEIINPDNWTKEGKFIGDISVNDIRFHLSEVYLGNLDNDSYQIKKNRLLSKFEIQVFLQDRLELKGEWREGIKEFTEGGISNKRGVIYDNGDRYYGDLSNGIRNRGGEMFYVTGEYYNGEWMNDLRHGKGSLFCHDVFKKGSCCELPWWYIGGFKNGKFHGRGEYFSRSKYKGKYGVTNYRKIIREGLWENGEFIGEE